MSYQVDPQRNLSPPAHDRRAPSSRQGSLRGVRNGDYTLAHAGRQFRLGPIGFWLIASTILIMALWSAGTATYFAFRDDLLTRLIARQAEMQYAYEDRIAELRAQIDRLTSRQLLDQEQIERRIEQLGRRQSMLEQRSSALSELPEPFPTARNRPPARHFARPEAGASGAQTPSAAPDSAVAAPADQRRSSLPSRLWPAHVDPTADKDSSVSAMLDRIEESLDRVEARQSAALLALEDRYDAKARKMRDVLAELGLDLKQIAAQPANGVGGPFVPVQPRAGGAFERQLHRVHLARTHIDRLHRTLGTVPLRKPLHGELDSSSGYGVRLDPFLRAPAMHSGLDFRAPTGAPVRATAAGVVTAAGWSGGYGRMVEVDHGNGFSTRYGHLSAILVKEGQSVKPGQVVGRVGSTGRSTGPHLHYETRIDGDPVDPHKFLRAGLRLGEKL